MKDIVTEIEKERKQAEEDKLRARVEKFVNSKLNRRDSINKSLETLHEELNEVEEVLKRINEGNLQDLPKEVETQTCQWHVDVSNHNTRSAQNWYTGTYGRENYR